MNETSDIIILRIPRGARALPVMRVVMGGVASRHDVPLDKLDDLQLAVETLVTEEPAEGNELRLELSAGDDCLRVRLSGLLNQSVRVALVAVDPFHPCEGCLLDVRFLLDSLVDRLEVEESGGDSYGVFMEKRAS
ncbi:MAG: hypothetical protein JW990_02525 [Thermoleophilia bacterium]|nr:hypothetical protein [Thermoleophilia bacterium]